MFAVTVGEIVDLVGGRYSGPREQRVTGVATLAEAGEAQISFLSNPKYASQLETTRAGVILVSEDAAGDSPRYIRVRNPYYALATVASRWFASRPRPSGISPLAVIAQSARMGANVAIGPFCVIGDNVVIGNNVTIYQGCSIEAETVIGDDTLIYPMVSLYYRSIVGKRCILHSGVVIGADGFGFATEGGKHHKVPQIGIVRIGDDVEIGAGSTVDRAALGETTVGDGTKIDNLVQVGHNVKIGKHCVIVAQSGIAGSTELGDYVVMAGQSGITGHLKLGTESQIAAKSTVMDDVPPKTKVMGTPAIPFRDFARREVLLKRLPELVKRVSALEKKSGGHEAES